MCRVVLALMFFGIHTLGILSKVGRTKRVTS